MTVVHEVQPTPRETDEALVARLGQGDEAALRVLHQRYAALVFTVASRFVDAAAAEEAVQDVFVTLWKKHETFDATRGTFRGWLVQIARRRALNELRRRKGQGQQPPTSCASRASRAPRRPPPQGSRCSRGRPRGPRRRSRVSSRAKG
jgi:DNA-directed RNA polymerase specialized sigma24 family protein